MSAPPPEEMNLLYQQICQALADPKRMQILYALHDHPSSVTDLVETLNFSQSTVSRHLTLLRQRALVNTTRKATQIVYRLADLRIIRILDSMRELLRDILEQQISAVTQGDPQNHRSTDLGC